MTIEYFVFYKTIPAISSSRNGLHLGLLLKKLMSNWLWWLNDTQASSQPTFYKVDFSCGKLDFSLNYQKDTIIIRQTAF